MEIRLKPIRIADAPLLEKSGIFQGGLEENKRQIRRMVGDPSNLFFLVFDNEQNRFLSVSGVAASHRFPVCAVYETYENQEIMNSENKVYWIPGDFSTQKSRRETMRQILYQAFFSCSFHRVGCFITTEEKGLEEAALSCGMQQYAYVEGLKETGKMMIGGGYFSVSSVEYPEYGVGFIPYDDGIVAVYGRNDVVDKVQFFSYGDSPEDTYTRRSASHMGLLTDGGFFCDRSVLESYPSEWEYPAEVKKAMQEISEYFGKTRTRFSVRISPSLGTAFQRAVWDCLLRIPYGQTVSYADVAMEIAGDDTASAKKLTRAVGGACGANPCPVLIPCHRVIGKNRHLTGFSAGLGKKAFLLDHEIFGMLRGKA